MNRPMDRRRALLALGALGAGVVAAACSNGDNDAGDAGDGATDGKTSATTTPSSTAPSPTGTAPGALSAAMFDRAGACSLTPGQIEGPYYLDMDQLRGDIREDRRGARLRVGLRVRDGDCRPVPDAAVDIWHCDATGLYSGFEAASKGLGSDTDQTRYLRGTQVTNAEGIVEFTTVYPGWYRGRTVHIHAKVRRAGSALLTTQLYFDDAFTATVYEAEPYSSDSGRDTFNNGDGFYDRGITMAVSEDGDGLLGIMNLDVPRNS